MALDNKTERKKGAAVELPELPTAVLETLDTRCLRVEHEHDKPLLLSRQCYDILATGGDPYAQDELPVMGSNQRIRLLPGPYGEWDSKACWEFETAGN